MRFLPLLLSALLLAVHAQDNSSIPVVADSTPSAATTPDAVTTTAATTTVQTTTTQAVTTTANGDPTSTVSVTATTPTAAPTTTGTTSTAAPTTPAPPALVAGTWNLTDPVTKVACFKIELAAEIQLNFQMKTAVPNVIQNVVLQPNDTISGDCFNGSTTQIVHFLLSEGTPQTLLTLTFIQHSDQTYGLTSINFDGYLIDVTDAVDTGLTINATAENREGDEDADYKVDSGSFYRCDTQIPTNLTLTNANATVVTAILQHFRYQAFVNKNEWSTERRCGADFGTSDIVPIAVGCALAALVVIVLIAYLIGRRRSRQKGYQSV